MEEREVGVIIANIFAAKLLAASMLAVKTLPSIVVDIPDMKNDDLLE